MTSLGRSDSLGRVVAQQPLHHLATPVTMVCMAQDASADSSADSDGGHLFEARASLASRLPRSRAFLPTDVFGGVCWLVHPLASTRLLLLSSALLCGHFDCRTCPRLSA